MTDEHKSKEQLIEELLSLRAENERLKSGAADKLDFQEEATFRSLYDSSFEAIFLSRKGICIAQNQAAQDMFGYTLEEAIGRYGTEWIAPKDHQTVMNNIMRGYEEPYRVEALRKDGSTFPCEIRGKMIEYQRDQIRVTALRDISIQIQAEESNNARKRYLESVLSAAPDAIVVMDTKHNITEWNPGAEKLFGYTEKDALGKKLDALITKPDIYQHAVALTEQVASGRDLPPREVIRYNKNGELLNMIAAGSPIIIDGQLVGIVAVYTDISEQKAIENALRESERELRREKEFTNTVLDSQIDTFFLFEPATGRAIRWNKAFREISGYTDAEIASLKAPESYYSAADLEKAQAFLETMPTRGSGTIVLDLTTKDGKIIPTEYAAAFLYDENDNPRYVISIGRDITERKQSQARLQESEEKFRTIVTQSQPIIFVIDQDGIFLVSEGKGLAALGLKPGQVVGTSALELYKDYPAIVKGITSALKGESLRYVVELGEIYLDTTYSPLKNAAGEITSLIGMAIDITEQKKTEKELEFLATHDALTKLPNRLLFNTRLEQAIKRGLRYKTELAVLFLDLDLFKSINDAFGHAAGDKLLEAVAERIQSKLRENDTVARIGGDEFLVLLEDIQDSTAITPIAEKILDEVSKPFYLAEQEVFITGSIGISMFPTDADDTDSLIRHANTAMYRAKMRGRNLHEYFSADMTVRTLERLTLISQMRRSLENEDFVLFFQPQIDIKNNQVIGVEALIRWQHPERGLLLPKDFLTEANDSGLIVALDEWGIQAACKQMVEWQQAGYTGFRLCVNLSERQIKQKGLIDYLKSVLHETGLNPALLELELAEKIIFQVDQDLLPLLDQIKALGIRISMDDFGVGYSSLGQLTQLPLDVLKIDQSFASKVTKSEKDLAVLAGILNIAHNLNIKVIGEGIEIPEQMAIYQQHGCTIIQGNHLSPAVPPDKLLVLLKNTL